MSNRLLKPPFEMTLHQIHRNWVIGFASVVFFFTVSSTFTTVKVVNFINLCFICIISNLGNFPVASELSDLRHSTVGEKLSTDFVCVCA
jgi:hypothetical protein